MKDEHDIVTVDWAESCMLQPASHYQALVPYTRGTISGHRWNGSTTPDDVRQKWRTPDWMFNYLNQRYGGFTIDAAASKEDTKCDKFFTEEDDALTMDVAKGSRVFCNPPFGDLEPWIDNFIHWSKVCKAEVTVILPHDLSTKWARKAVLAAAEIIHVISDGVHSGRVAFVSPVTGKPGAANNKGTLILHFNPKAKCSRTLYLDRPMMEKIGNA